MPPTWAAQNAPTALTSNAAAPTADTTAVRGEAGRIIAQGAIDGTVSEADRAYLAQVVAANTGLPPEEATARVEQTLTAIDTARQAAADAAEKARKTGVVAAFLTAAALLVSAVGAFWAAQVGGNHRDNNTYFRTVFRRT